MVIDRILILASLAQRGFRVLDRQRHILLVNVDSEVSPAFIPVIRRCRGHYRISGGFGLYVSEFEGIWRKAITKEELKVDRTLPIIISIENFAELNDAGVFRPLDSVEAVEKVSRLIFELCSSMPQSVERLLQDISECSLLGKDFERYIHYFSDIDSSNIYFRKSAAFIHWASAKWPDVGQAMSACLHARTRSLVARYPQDP